MPMSDLDLLAINTVRTLSMDAVQKAESGHPGTPMALAPLAYVLYTRIMRHDPSDPAWPDRRGPQTVPSVGKPDPGTPRIRLHPRRRGDHRTAWPGDRQCRRHGRRRGTPRSRVQQAGQ